MSKGIAVKTSNIGKAKLKRVFSEISHCKVPINPSHAKHFRKLY